MPARCLPRCLRRRQLSQRAPAYAIALLLSLMPMTGLTQTKVKSGFNLFAPQQDVEIGQQSAIEAEKQLPILRDSRAAEYLNRLGQTLAAQAPGERYPYTFKMSMRRTSMPSRCRAAPSTSIAGRSKRRGAKLNWRA